MLITLLVLAMLPLLWALRRCTQSWRWSVLGTMLLGGFWVAAICEILSFFRALNAQWITVSWCAIGLLHAGVLAWSRWRWRRVSPSTLSRRSIDDWVPASVALLVGAVGVMAIATPPNNWDSMTYHMPRVMHWLQNQTVQHYPTHVPRQLYQGPFAGFVILQAHALKGDDRFANAVQWVALAGSCVIASLAARTLGCGRFGQYAAAAFVATLPMALLQASNTQNDLVLSLWMIALTACVLVRPPSTSGLWLATVGCGASLGLAMLTKGTGYLFTPPIFLWFVARRWGHGFKHVVAHCAVIGAIALLLNAGHMTRNYRVFGSPFGMTREAGTFRVNEFSNDRFTPPVLVSNVVRNVALHLAVPYVQPDYFVAMAVQVVHDVIGIDPNDPGTTWAGERFRISSASWPSGDLAGNPLHLFVSLAAIGVLFVAGRRRQLLSREDQRACVALLFAIVGGLLLFSLYMRWQPWHARLHLPLFVVAAPAFALAVERAWSRRWATVALVAMLLAGTQYVIHNHAHPLSGPRSIWSHDRLQEMFRTAPAMLPKYYGLAQFVRQRGDTHVGLVMNNDEWEYPLWVMLADIPGLQMHHVGVNNVTTPAKALGAEAAFEPTVILTIKADQQVLRVDDAASLKSAPLPPR